MSVCLHLGLAGPSEARLTRPGQAGLPLRLSASSLTLKPPAVWTRTPTSVQRHAAPQAAAERARPLACLRAVPRGLSAWKTAQTVLG